MARMESPERKERVSARIGGIRLEKFEKHIDETGESKSELIRKGIDAILSGTMVESTPPLHPPAENHLEYGYRQLFKAANADGYVKSDTAKRVCSGGPENIAKSEVYDLVLKKLLRRGYIKRTSNLYGDTAYKLTGWNNEE